MLTVDFAKHQSLAPAALHLQVNTAWTIPKPIPRRMELVKTLYVQALDVLTCYFNGVPAAIERMQRSTPEFSNEAIIRWNIRVHELSQAALAKQAMMWQSYTQTHSVPHQFKNIYAVSLNHAELADAAFALFKAELSNLQTQASEEQLCDAAGGALVFMLLCFRNILNGRSVDGSDDEVTREWGSGTVLFDRRFALSQLHLAPTPSVGAIGSLSDALVEEFVFSVLEKTAGAADAQDNDGSFFSRFKAEFLNVGKRAEATRAVPMGFSRYGTTDFSSVVDVVTTLFRRPEVRDYFIVVGDFAEEWRSHTCAELMAALNLVMEHDKDARRVATIQRELELYFKDISATPLSALSEVGFSKIVHLITELQTARQEDYDDIYSAIKVELERHRPATFKLPKLSVIKTVKPADLLRCVFWPHAEFTRTKGVLAGLDQESITEHTIRIGLSKPRFVLTDTRLKLAPVVADTFFTAPFVSGEASIYPMFVDKVTAVDDITGGLGTIYSGYLGGWQELVNTLAYMNYEEKGTLVGSVSVLDGNKKDAQGEPKLITKSVNWGDIMGEVAALKLLSQDSGRVFAPVFPSVLWKYLGIMVDHELRPLLFETVSRTAVEPLRAHIKTDSAFVLRQELEAEEAQDILKQYIEVCESGELDLGWLVGHGLLSPALVSGSEVADSWETLLALPEAKFEQISGFTKLLFDLETPARDLAVMRNLEFVAQGLLTFVNSNASCSEVRFIRDFDKESRLHFANPRRKALALDLVRMMFDPVSYAYNKQEVRKLARDLCNKIVGLWASHLTVFKPEVVRVIQMFLKERGSFEWVRLARRHPEDVANMKVVLVALLLGEFFDDAALITYLSAHGLVKSTMRDRRLAIVPELVTPYMEEISTNGVEKGKAKRILEAETLAEFVTLFERVVAYAVHDDTLEKQLGMIRATKDAALSLDGREASVFTTEGKAAPSSKTTPKKGE